MITLGKSVAQEDTLTKQEILLLLRKYYDHYVAKLSGTNALTSEDMDKLMAFFLDYVKNKKLQVDANTDKLLANDATTIIKMLKDDYEARKSGKNPTFNMDKYLQNAGQWMVDELQRISDAKFGRAIKRLLK